MIGMTIAIVCGAAFFALTLYMCVGLIRTSDSDTQFVGVSVALIIIGFTALLLSGGIEWRQPQCHFDRNEPGPQGWWWEIYKCSDGSERRALVASPRG